MATPGESKVVAISSAEKGATQTHDLYAARPAAGVHAPGADRLEKPLNINYLLINNPTATFFVKVEGDSMEGAKIFSGDILVVDRSIIPTTGKIVVAAVYGEMVVKRLVIQSNGTFLMSEKDGYEPIVVSDNDDCFVWGVIVGSVRVL